MRIQSYKAQVSLLLGILPEVAKEDSLAMHGGTAINLFVRDMPRVSVDIDLTYLPIEDRETSLHNISNALERIKTRIENLDPQIKVLKIAGLSKLLISRGGILVKLEVNQIMRGVISPVSPMALCQAAQNEFDAYCEMAIVPLGQLYGGKICAALDRQHPRDLFDVKYILQEDQFTTDIKAGFFYCLLSSARPIHEMLNPFFQDLHIAMKNQFEGMTEEVFTYEDYEASRTQLIENIQAHLTVNDKAFLRSFNRLNPDWSVYDFQQFSAVRWKLQNLERLRESHPEKFKEQCELLERLL